MIKGPTPPTAAVMAAKFDAQWAGRAHRNVCVKIDHGTATINAPGMPDYVLYFTPPHEYVTATERDKQIAIVTPDDPLATGTVCLGIADR